MNVCNGWPSRPQGARQFHFGNVVGIEHGNQIVIGDGNRSLSLYHFDGVSDSGREAVASLRQRLVGKIEIASSNGHLVGCRLDVKESGPDLVIDLAAEIGEFVLTLLQGSPGFGR